MKILVDDGMQVAVGTGIGKYTEHLVSALNRIGGVSADLSAYEPKANGRLGRRAEYMRRINSREFYEFCREYDIVHFTNFLIPRIKLGSCCVVTIHDMTSFLYPKTLSKLFVPYSRFIIRAAVRGADLVLSVSKSACEEIRSAFPRYSSKISFVYPGDCKESAPNSNGDCGGVAGLSGADRFFLFVGTLEERKNLAFVVDAFSRFREANPDASTKLVLAGRPGEGYEFIAEAVERSCACRDVVLTGYISDSERDWLYAHAVASIFPSIYEGFGLPQLESMRFGTPLIASRIPTNVEVSGDYATFFDLGDLEGLSRCMERADGLGRPVELVELGRSILGRFDWDRSAGEFVEAYGRCLGSLATGRRGTIS